MDDDDDVEDQDINPVAHLTLGYPQRKGEHGC